MEAGGFFCLLFCIRLSLSFDLDIRWHYSLLRLSYVKASSKAIPDKNVNNNAHAIGILPITIGKAGKQNKNLHEIRNF